MILSLGLLLLCQLSGEAVARGLALPLPGPVIGMALLLALLLAREKFAAVLPREVGDGTLEKTSNGLLSHLSLMFIPAGVGVVQRLVLFISHGVALFLALLLSTALAMLASVAAFRFIARLMGERE
ncbi:MAG: CidA/LrgA family protein [Hyphomicrobiales bacterium]|nr:CidA/LrgA family protein [Hyphomicrobiales bacterium]